ncbi:MAG TPA: S49 family peptidase, partial [Burkholderiaceae bacterium]|nr:S49 family peptidase [Burkholderiaceae bacterium]
PVSGPRQRFAVASELAPRIRALADSARVQAIVLALDTRGGTVTGSDRIWSAARYALGRKPVIAWMRNYAASGGYYIAAAAQSIIASSFTITGSIGVISWKPNVAEACARLGVNPVLISRGGSARMTSVFRPFDEQALEWLEAEIDASYAQFKAVVAEGRRMSDEQVESVAKGRVWTAAQALERGLVDRVGHYRDVLIAARELAQIPQHRRHVVRWIAPPASPLQMLRRFSAQALPAAGVGPPPALAAFVDELYEPWLLAQESPLMYYLPAMTLRC